ncbi:tripartite tricarboxylate transporter substrate binding protein [Verticiella sediminum]|uniref:Tripartite tricarboxylate transporter substrate binding protein n=1 Tax=Verticiella sediminum TaxID=1247510 RepID=A0A556AJG4_9BURK|nr:tripartite tricarboxylate transporter substrate binding protein [Verticiella sediminum]TSH93048.1 tripartite tricarboxylate transporter substrate binding protein [Verticiella sediminum]
MRTWCSTKALPACLALSAALFAAAYAAAHAADRAGAAGDAASYPNQPVKLLVATTAGGTADTLARAIGKHMSERWGQPIVVEQRVGANGMIASAQLKRAPADGYTVYLSLSSMVQNVLLQKEPGYALTDFAPVSQVAVFPIAAVLNGEVPANSIDEVLALAGRQPGKLSYGSYGIGSGGHIVGAGLAHQGKVDMVHVPYAGEAAGFPDLVSGRITLFYASLGFVAQQAEAGKVKLLAVASPARLRQFPDIPTFAEEGFEAVNLPGWSGFFMPRDTPRPIVEKFSAAVRDAVADPAIHQLIEGYGYVPVGNTPDEFQQVLRTDLQGWRRVIEASAIRLD